MMLFRYFKVPPGLQKLCLDYGIYGAVILRAVCIFGGLAIVKSFQPVLLLFSGMLLYSSYMMLFSEEQDEDDEEKPPDMVQQVLNQLPTTPNFDGDKLVVS